MLEPRETGLLVWIASDLGGCGVVGTRADASAGRCIFKSRMSVVYGAGCGEAEFHCTDGRCIGYGLQCNGVNECSDGSDERDCGNYIIPSSHTQHTYPLFHFIFLHTRHLHDNIHMYTHEYTHILVLYSRACTRRNVQEILSVRALYAIVHDARGRNRFTAV